MLTYILMSFLALSLGFVIYLTKSLFGHRKKHAVQDGEFFVNGNGHAAVKLFCHEPPRKISVYFADDFHSHPCHPCNPHRDWLDWELVRVGHDCFKLNIFYDVGNLRTIFYRIEY